MKETKELFEEVLLLSNFDDLSFQELVALQNRLQKFISQVSIAKENGYYFQLGPETPSSIGHREKAYDEIFSEEENIDVERLSVSPRTKQKVLSLSQSLQKINDNK